MCRSAKWLSDKIKNVNNKKSILQNSPIYAYQSIRFDEIFYVLCFSSPNLSSFSVNFKKIEQITFLDFSNIFYRCCACKFLILLVLCVYYWNLFLQCVRKILSWIFQVLFSLIKNNWKKIIRWPIWISRENKKQEGNPFAIVFYLLWELLFLFY